MKTEGYFQLSVILVAALFVAGCSELKNGSVPVNPVFVYVHPDGFKSPSSPNFHGVAIRNSGWEIRTCRQCHGGSYTGDNAISCVSAGCHVDANGTPKSPESCNTCHGNFASVATDSLSWAPPRSTSGDTAESARGVGAHQFHLNAAYMDLSEPLACNSCHNVPSGAYAGDHPKAGLPAPVIFVNALAKIPSGGQTPSPSYDPQALQCSNTYCHGNWRLQKSASSYKFVFSDSVISGANFAPQWTGGDSQDACGTCHGIPPAGHQNFGTSVSTCTSCHYLNASKQGGPLDPTIHINGKIDLYGQEYSFR
jgi:predicted CxxxxCH...CXXCH cytochrome family protein